MGQVIEYNTRGYCVLYRGGYDIQNKKGLDKFNRKREYLNLNLDDSWNNTVSNGLLLHHNHPYRTSSVMEITDFLGIDFLTTYDCFVNCNLKVCFTNDGRIILYKNTDPDPVKVTKTTKNRTKECKMWLEENAFLESPYTFTYWKFKKGVKYLVFDFDWRYLFGLLPVEYERLNIIDLHNKFDYIEAYKRLFELDPIDLNDSWDYTDEQKREIEIAKKERQEKIIKANEELEIRKNTPGYCSCCGEPGANYVDDPYDYEIYGVHNKRWLCPHCEHEFAMDV